MAYRVHPSMVLTPEDWIAQVRPRDRKTKPFAIGVNGRISEDAARRNVELLLSWRRVGIADIVMKRRWQVRKRIEDMHPENLRRFDKNATR